MPPQLAPWGSRGPAGHPAGATAVIVGLLAILALVVPLLGTPRQEPVQTFRVRTDVVQLDVSVLDRDGQPVRGLTAGDFTVLKDGVAQPIVAFAEVEVPTWTAGTAPWAREIGPDVASNRLDARRAVVIVMDDFSRVSGADPLIPLAKSIATAAIDGLGPADLAAVVYVSHRSRGQEFTLDRTRLREAVNRFVPSAEQAGEGPFAASKPGRGLETPSRVPVPRGECYARDCVAEALHSVADILGGWPGARKTVVLISPGRQPREIAEGLEPSDLGLLRERALMFAALQNANVNVYQFDPHGLQTAAQTQSDFGAFAEQTGGRAITSTNAPADFVPQMYRENSSYYLLGLRPDDARDGRFHRIRVRVNRPDVQLRTRAGYYAPPSRPPAKPKQVSAVERALSGGLPSGELPVSVTVAPFATAGRPGAAVAVVARLDHEADLAGESVIEFVAAAFDDKWKQVTAVTQRFMLPPADSGGRFSETALRLNLPPGRYEVRTAMRNTADDRTGSVYASVTVPDFAREVLSLSGIVVERRSGGAAMPDDLAGIVPGRPTTIRQFTAGERAGIVARVYQRRAKVLAPVRVSVRIADAQDRAAFTTASALEPSAFGTERHADYRLDLPLDRLADGEYLLVLDASAGATSVRRTSRFTVRRQAR